MFLADTQLSASEVLRAFHHDEPRLFLGAAISTVGIVAAALCVIRRRADGLLISLAVFAILYGQRMWLEADLLRMTVPPNELFRRLREAVNPLVPVPAFLFFQIAGLLPRRGRVFTIALISVFLGLTAATLAVGWLPVFHTINNALVITALSVVAIHSLRQKSTNRDNVTLRRGMLVFVALALWDNTGGPRLQMPDLEAYGFAFFLGCMGYVAAHRTLERDRQLGELQSELDVARKIQLSLLPGDFPKSKAFEVAAGYLPMTSVAGDFYDFLEAGPERAGLLIADVSGHGVPAALIASMVKLAASSQKANAASPAKLLEGMNSALCGNTQGQFVTAAYVHLDAKARSLRYAAAGHPAMLLLRGNKVAEIAENGLLLAATESAEYTEKSVALETGDRLLLYTDGLVEAKNAEGNLFGDEALRAALLNTSAMKPADASKKILAEVQRWAKAQDDDLTVLVCDFIAAT